MAQILEYVKIALMNIKSNKGRSVLTMLGIIIGISSVILIITVGNGVKNGVNRGLDDLMGNQVQFSCDSENDQGVPIELTMKDFDDIKRNIDNVAAIYNSWSVQSEVTNRRGTFAAEIILGTPDFQMTYRKQPIVRGRVISDSDYYAKAPVCVITEETARMLFGTEDAVGMTIEVTLFRNPSEYTVIGVRKDPKLAGVISYVRQLMDDWEPTLHVEMPDSYIFSTLGYDRDMGINEFTVASKTAESQNQVAQDVLRYCEKKFDCIGRNKIHVFNFGEMVDQLNQLLDYVTLFVGLVAAISLLVGGIGVMNIMLVSVTERTREIGIRKALGARTSSIMLQFLSESAIITLVGGVAGIILGIGGAYLLCAAVNITAKVNIASVIGASVFSAAVGIFFGLYPAKKAANLSPIEALRHE